jgi:hypothetical protein
MRYWTATSLFCCALLSVCPAAADEPHAAQSEVKPGGPPTVKPPLSGHPIRFYSVPGSDVFALMQDHTLRALSSGDAVLEFDEEDKWTIGATFCAVTSIEKAACLYRATKSEGSGNQTVTYKKLVLVQGRQRKVVGNGSGDGYDIGPLGIHMTPDGRLLFMYSETEQRGQATVNRTWFVSDGEKDQLEIGSASLLATLANIGAGDRKDPPVQFIEFKGELWLVYRDGDSVAVKPLDGKKITVAPRSLHDIRPVVTADGWFYVFYHDAGMNTANFARSRDGRAWTTAQLDEKESGWQMEAVAHGDQAICAFYYMRNTFNKGLRFATLKGGAVQQAPITIVREENFNTGWHPNLGVAADGTVWLTWLHNVEEKQRVWSKLASPADLKKHEITGGSGWEEGYKDYFLQTGVGAWYTWWMLADSVPSAADINGADIQKTHYNVGPAVLMSANLEARYGSMNLGASYAQSVVDEASQAIGGSSGVLNGQVKIDDLMLGHDLKLGFLWGRYRGRAVPQGQDFLTYDPEFFAANPESELPIKTDFVDVQVLLLNKWRIKYGLDYSTYAVPASLHAWRAGENTTRYDYKGSFFRNVTFRHFNFILGYSKLDYAAKYENHYNNFFLDGAFAFGYSMLKFDPVTIYDRPADVGVADPIGLKSSGSTFNMRVIAQAGWLYFHRWKSTRGLGMYVRPAYMADWSYIGSGGKPRDRESEQAKAENLTVRAGINSLRHGPWLDLGIVW